ncbi:MAG TPA: HisA/HisF-related TIM barrel protein [Candidatus Acidoferrales bacterium]|nr:HisA/HisF-related TIM barrel protein [Candidatus Acidoferrales bacterium]
MLIPCIDLQGGCVVQLVRGRRRVIAIRDVMAVAGRFRSYPIVHVIDLDAATRRGTNWRWVRALCRQARHSRRPKLRVGGGIRTVRRAERLLRWGADQVIVGSAAFLGGRVNHSFLRRLVRKVGRRRVVIALDTEGGRIAVRGWQRKLRLGPEDVIRELEPYAAGFLCTYIDAEGAMSGTNLGWFRELRRLTARPIIAAGGIRGAGEVRALERLGMDAAVGMAVYLGKLR